jgi:hypothetical protein
MTTVLDLFNLKNRMAVVTGGAAWCRILPNIGVAILQISLSHSYPGDYANNKKSCGEIQGPSYDKEFNQTIVFQRHSYCHLFCNFHCLYKSELSGCWP